MVFALGVGGASLWVCMLIGIDKCICIYNPVAVREDILYLKGSLRVRAEKSINFGRKFNAF